MPKLMELKHFTLLINVWGVLSLCSSFLSVRILLRISLLVEKVLSTRLLRNADLVRYVIFVCKESIASQFLVSILNLLANDIYQVLVMASVGKWDSVGGDIKFLRLKQREIGGLVTDGSVRDTDEIIDYGFPCFSYSTTARQGPAYMQPWKCNDVVCVGGVSVRPGDAIVGDQDGVVVVPAKVAETVYNIAHGREEIEGLIKEELTKNPGPPGIYYPFMSGKIKVDSPLGKLLATKGITPENSNQFEGSADW
jgi:hypothetical protein